MAIDITTVAEALFEKVRARFEGVSVGDESAKATQDPKLARFFNFDYTDDMGNNFGNVTVSIIDERSLKIYFGKNLSADLSEEQKKEWYDFLRDMRMFAMRNLMTFDTRDISRSNLNLKDLKQLSSTEAPKAAAEINVSESRLFGSTKTSYDKVAPGYRLIIRHSAPVDDQVFGARSRKIESVFIEDRDGQRFKIPFTHLGGCRAMARHVANGGQCSDPFGEHITDLVQEMGKIRDFIRGSRNKVYEDDEANEMAKAARDRYKSIHHILQKLAKHKSYQFYKQEWKPSKTLQDDIDLEALRNKFIEKDFDNRLDAALPHVYAAYHAMKEQPMEPAYQPHLDEFEQTMDTIEEGTWSLPDSDLKVKKLQELMSDVLVAGIDGADAAGALYDILGDDDLYDRIYDASRGSPEMDVRPIVYDWLQDHMPDVGKQIEAALEGGSAASKEAEETAPPEDEQPPEDDEAQPAPAAESVVREGKMISEYYSVEADSAPYFLHSTKFLNLAMMEMKKAQKQGRNDVKIYEVRVVDGKKVKKELNATKSSVVAESNSSLNELRRLAGLK